MIKNVLLRGRKYNAKCCECDQHPDDKNYTITVGNQTDIFI